MPVTLYLKGRVIMVKDMAAYIDHTQLKPDTTLEKINQILAEAKEYSFASVCVNPYWVSHCAKELENSNVKVCTVIGFPLGASATKIKEMEAKQAIKDGATEIDMVLNIGELKTNNDEAVRKDIQTVVAAVKNKAVVKVILETALLTKNEKIRACMLAKEAGTDFVKTSTGFSDGGATAEDVSLMRDTVGDNIGVKASGGIRDLETAQKMIRSGATRIGASASVDIVS